MAFGRKKAEAVAYDQDNVTSLAAKALENRRQQRVMLALRLRGTFEMLQHRWTQKAIMEMLGNMVGQKQPRTEKDLTQEYEASFFRNTEQQVCIPCRIIKACVIDGATGTSEMVTKADLKRSLRVVGHTAPLKMGNEIIKLGHKAMKMDARIAMNNQKPDVRARAIIATGWTADIVVQFGAPLTPDQVIAAITSAGDIIGLCDYRPEKGGDYGTFSVETLPPKHIDAILEANAIPEEMFVIPPEMLRAFRSSIDGAPKKSNGAVGKAVAVHDQVNGQRKSRHNGVEAS